MESPTHKTLKFYIYSCMKLPNSLFRLLGGLIVLFLFSSCGSQYHLASYYNNDPIYGIVEQTGDTIKIDVLDSEWDIDRKFRFDDKFRWNFAQYAMKQDLRWHYDFYWNNRMYRSPFASPFDFYWNSNQYWWNWSSNYPFNYGFNHWDRFGFFGYGDPYYYGYRYNPYRWYYPSNWYDGNWFRYNQGIAYNFNRENQNISYNRGRRGSSNVIVTPNGNRRGNGNNVIANPNIRIRRGNDVISPPRNYGDGIPNPNDVDVIVDNRDRNFIGRLFDKIENSNVRIRTYNNPNNVPNNIRNYNRVENGNSNNYRNNNNNVRNYNTPPRNNFNNIRSSSPPVRSYSPPPSSSNISRGSSSGGAVISRGSSGGRNNID